MQSLLLRRTYLPNDDALLEFFTDQCGRLTLKVPKLGVSIKRQREIDFFRLIELTLSEHSHHPKLKKAESGVVFSAFADDYALNQAGFRWLDLLRSHLPEEKPAPELFSIVGQMFVRSSRETWPTWEAFFRCHLLQMVQPLPRFDLVRSDTYFCPKTLHFSSEAHATFLFLDNLTRQVFEFFRRSTLDDFSEKSALLPPQNVKKVLSLLDQITLFHT